MWCGCVAASAFPLVAKKRRTGNCCGGGADGGDPTGRISMDGDDAIRRTCPDDGGGEKRQQRRMPDKSTDPSTSKPVRDDAPGIRRRNGRVIRRARNGLNENVLYSALNDLLYMTTSLGNHLHRVQ